MIAVDTSVVVAGFASWHEGHGPAAAVLARGPRVPAHVLVETYSVLTRLPPPHRAPPDIVTAFLAQRFRQTPLTLAPRAWPRLLDRAAEFGVTGGAVYDALIAATVRQAGATLLTRDRRAAAVYEKMGAAYELVF
jgi:predicted nucleic acid-binding protein